MNYKYYNMGVIGSPAAHSLSPVLHSYLLQERGLVGGYNIFDVPESRIRKVLDHGAMFHYSGFNVTLPYKKHIMSMCHHMDPIATSIGAVNTVKLSTLAKKGGHHGSESPPVTATDRELAWHHGSESPPVYTLTGYNTDVVGFAHMLQHKNINPADQNVLVLGAGGGARSVVHHLDAVGAKVQVFNRTVDTAVSLIADMGANATIATADNLAQGDFYLIVNTTSSGVHGEAFTALPPGVNLKLTHAVDLIYTQKVGGAATGLAGSIATPFLSHMGADVSCDGLLHLIYQGVESFEIFVRDTESQNLGTTPATPATPATPTTPTTPDPEFIDYLYAKLTRIISGRQ